MSLVRLPTGGGWHDRALALIKGTNLDTGTYLDKLKKLSPSDQITAAKRDLAWEREREARKAEQAENDRKREEHAAALPQAIKDREAAKAKAVAARKAAPVDVDALTAELDELREANTALETDVAALKADNVKWETMRVQFEQGGFEKIITGKDEEIRVLQTRVESESRDKALWANKAKFWKDEAIKLGWKNGDFTVDIETGEIADA